MTIWLIICRINYDRDYVGVVDGIGPVERRLGEFGEVHGLVVGAFGEGSEDLHNLLQVMAESRVTCVDLLRGQPGAGAREELGVVVGQLRRRLSVAAVRANSNCLLTRLALVGDGARQASDRRQWRKREEHLMRKEREAQWHRQIRGYGITHRGEF